VYFPLFLPPAVVTVVTLVLDKAEAAAVVRVPQQQTLPALEYQDKDSVVD
jgi:hypothetical protein